MDHKVLLSLHEITLKAINTFDSSKNGKGQCAKAVLLNLQKLQINCIKFSSNNNNVNITNNNNSYDICSDDMITLLLSASQNKSQTTYTRIRGEP